MKHFYLNVFFPFFVSARDLVNAALSTSFSKNKKPGNSLDRVAATTLSLFESFSKEKLKEFNVLKMRRRACLAQVLPMVVGEFKELNIRLFEKQIALDKGLVSFTLGLFYQSDYFNNLLTS